VFRAPFFVLDKLDYIARFAAAKAMEGVGAQVYFAAWFVVIVEGAFNVAVLVHFNSIVGQYLGYSELFFDLGYFHFSMTFMVSCSFSGTICTKSPMLKPDSCSHKPSNVRTGASFTLLCDLQSLILRAFCFAMKKV